MDREITNPKSSMVDHFAVVLAVVATALTWLQFVAPIYDDPIGGPTAIGDPAALAFYIPAILVTTIATVLAFRPSLRGHAAILLLLTGILSLLDFLGFLFLPWAWIDTLGLAICASLLVSGVLLARRSDVRLRGPKLVWPALAGVAAVAWVAGYWLPWTSYETRTEDGKRLENEIESCCRAFEGGGWQSNLHQALVFGLLVIAALVVARIRPASISGLGLVALAVLYFEESASWLQDLTNPAMNRQELIDYGFDIDKIKALDATVTASAAPGGWIALSALIALVIIGIARSRAGDDPVPAAATQSP